VRLGPSVLRVWASVFLEVVVMCHMARARVITVDNAASLTAAVAHAGPHETIIVRPGVYKMHLLVRTPIVLIGDKGAVIDGGGHGNVIWVKATDVTIEGFVIRNSGRSLTRMDAGIFIAHLAAHVLIKDNRIEHVLFGIWLDGPKRPRIIANVVRGFRQLRTQDRGDGIHLWNVSGALISGNNVRKVRDGIYIYVSNGNTIQNNVMSDLRYGIHYMYSNHNIVTGNRTYETRTGYALMQSDHLTVVGNRSDRDRHYGILMNDITYSTIARNEVIGVKGQAGVPGGQGKALFVYNSQYNRIQGNLFAKSAIGVHFTAGSMGNVIYGNAFVHNRVQVKYVQRRGQEWSFGKRGNYWSDYLGWDLNGDGIGDVPYQINDAMDRLLWMYPVARLLMNSPTVEMLRWAQTQFPVLRPPGVTDKYPLMRQPFQKRGR